MAAVTNPPKLQRALGRLGLGCANFGRETPRELALAMMDHATANGITHFDTAAAYSSGGSEQLVGEWLASRNPSSCPFIATKVKPSYSPAALRQNVDASRRRLGVDTLDLLYVHQ